MGDRGIRQDWFKFFFFFKYRIIIEKTRKDPVEKLRRF